MLIWHWWTASLSCIICTKHHKASADISYFIFLPSKEFANEDIIIIKKKEKSKKMRKAAQYINVWSAK